MADVDVSQHSISDLKQLLTETKGRKLLALLDALEGDRRAGVVKLAASRRAKLEWRKRESARLAAMLKLERALYEEGHRMVAGVDEAGRGALAGPLVAAAVIMPRGLTIEGVRDSKELPPWQRERLYDEIVRSVLAHHVVAVPPDEIDDIGLQRANLEALARAVIGLDPAADFALSDGFALRGLGRPSRAVIKGDRLSHSIAAASIVAKVTRDRLMIELDRDFPGYAFAENKGYQSAAHLAALDSLGPSAIHRRSFAPVMMTSHRTLW